MQTSYVYQEVSNASRSREKYPLSRTYAIDAFLKLLVIERDFIVPVGQLFEAFKTAEAIKAWWWPKGLYTDHVDYDFNVGGRYFMNLKGDEKSIGMNGKFEEIVTDERIVMSDHFADKMVARFQRKKRNSQELGQPLFSSLSISKRSAMMKAGCCFHNKASRTRAKKTASKAGTKCSINSKPTSSITPTNLRPGKSRNQIFQALSDPTRRSILRKISTRERGVSEVAESYSMSLAAVSNHIQTLERAKLITKRKEGNHAYISLNADAMSSADKWIQYYRGFCESNLESLKNFIENEDK